MLDGYTDEEHFNTHDYVTHSVNFFYQIGYVSVRFCVIIALYY
jgi:hypothetical protein